MKQWYGSIQNRLEEDRMFCDTIEVGTLATRYYYSDREPYEVIEVINQNHVVLRELDSKRTDDNGPSECQDYEYSSNPNNYTMEIKRRKNGGWNLICRYKDEYGKIHANAVEKVHISFGKAERYYDFSF